MSFKSIFTSAFLTIPFFITPITTAEIFELVHDYDIIASDIESADFNNDGLEDFAVTEWIVDSSYFEVFLSNGDCSFTRLGPVYVDTSEVGQLLTGDFNEDANEDLLLMSLEETWLYIGDGTFNTPDYYEVTISGEAYQEICTCGDFNEDGYIDIAFTGMASMSAYSTYIFLNQQDGTFLQTDYEYFTGADTPERIATADLDLDGHLDLSMAMWGGSISGYGDGIFNISEPLSSSPGGYFIFSDMDLDGDLDLADRIGKIFINTTINLGIEGEQAGSMTNLTLDVSPNPFSSSVSISVSGLLFGLVNLQIYDVSGRLVTELEPVSYEGGAVFHWNGVASSGAELPSGIYTARLCSGNTITTATVLKLE